jgi:cytochrome c-type biogenesis protein
VLIPFLTSFWAGLTGLLSPCVLPLVPVLILGAMQAHTLAPLFLSLGIMTSFTGIVFILGHLPYVFNVSEVHHVFDIILIISGLLMISTRVSEHLQEFFTPFSSYFQKKSQSVANKRPYGYFILGLLLGGAWAPCATSSLGIVIGLFYSNTHLLKATVMASAYGLGMSLPFLILAYIVPERHWNKLQSLRFQKVMGIIMIATGLYFLFEI